MGTVFSCCRKSRKIRHVKGRSVNIYHIPSHLAHHGGGSIPYFNNFQRNAPPHLLCHPQFTNQMMPHCLPFLNHQPLLFQTPQPIIPHNMPIIPSTHYNNNPFMMVPQPHLQFQSPPLPLPLQQPHQLYCSPHEPLANFNDYEFNNSPNWDPNLMHGNELLEGGENLLGEEDFGKYKNV